MFDHRTYPSYKSGGGLPKRVHSDGRVFFCSLRRLVGLGKDGWIEVPGLFFGECC